MKTGLHLKRPCLLVADLERSLSLYRDVLGFEVDYVSPASPESYLYPVFDLPSAAELTFAALNTRHEVRAIALTQVKGIALPPPVTPQRVGVVIQVPNLQAICVAVKRLGLPILAANQFEAPPDRWFVEQGIQDFDGHLLILYEVHQRSP